MPLARNSDSTCSPQYLQHTERGFQIDLDELTGQKRKLLEQLDLDQNGVLDNPEIKRAMRDNFGLHLERGPMTPTIMDAILERLEHAEKGPVRNRIVSTTQRVDDMKGFDALYFEENPEADPNAPHHHNGGDFDPSRVGEYDPNRHERLDLGAHRKKQREGLFP